VRLRLLTTVGALSAALTLGTVAAAVGVTTDLGDLERQAAELSANLGTLDGDIGTTRSRLAVLTANLDDARAQLRVAEGQLALAQAASREATATAEAARTAHADAVEQLAGTRTELGTAEGRLAAQVATRFKYGTTDPRATGVLRLLTATDGDPNEFLHRMRQLERVADQQAAVVEATVQLTLDQAGAQDEIAATSRAETAAAQRAAAVAAEVEQLAAGARAVADRIERDEATVRAVLGQLELDRAQTASLREEVDGQVQALLARLAAQRAAHAAANGGGGPPVDGGYCPVRGVVAGRDFINDWGFPRSGGRRHQGNDVFAPTGTPVIAIADGVVTRMDPPSRPTRLGGITVTYETADGSRWYNAHLHTITPGLAVGSRISAGQQIATVGQTGNARTTPPHNHMQRYHGGRWINPYPTLAQLCR
jgi:peptidoglycan LD-endopeptidase LytH